MKSPIEQIIEKYPLTAREFLDQQELEFDLFCRKQLDYGPSNISLGTNLTTEKERTNAVTGIVIRMNDKIQRLVNLVMNNREPNNESISNYAKMITIVKEEKWGK